MTTYIINFHDTSIFFFIYTMRPTGSANLIYKKKVFILKRTFECIISARTPHAAAFNYRVLQ